MRSSGAVWQSAPRVSALLSAIAFLAACDIGALTQSVREATASKAEIEAEGATTDKQILIETPPVQNPALAAYFDRVGHRVAAGASYPATLRFTVLDDDVLNAYSVPGGFIYITRGELAMLNNEDELAMVVGHELGHLSGQHAIRQTRVHGGIGVLMSAGRTGVAALGVVTLNPLLILASQWGGNAAGSAVSDIVSASYSRSLESEADKTGIGSANAAGYQPQSAARVIQSFQDEDDLTTEAYKGLGIAVAHPHGIFGSHPDNLARLQAAKDSAAALTPMRRAPEADYLKQIDGLAYGPAHALGVQRGSNFYCQDFGLVFQVPSGWYVEQLSDHDLIQLIAPQSTARMILSRQEVGGDTDARSFAAVRLSGAILDQGRAISVASHKGWRGSMFYREQTYEILSWIDGDDGYLLLGRLAEKQTQKDWPQSFNRLGQSFRGLRTDETRAAQLPKIRIHVVAAGETWASLSRDAPLGLIPTARLRLLNGQSNGGTEPKVGTRIKIVR